MAKKYNPSETKEQRKWRKRQEKATKQVVKSPQVIQIETALINKPIDNTSQKIAFVLGNGTSRKEISYHQMHRHGKMYACNGVFREYRPDYLIAVDTKMIKEITTASYHLNNEVYTNPNSYTREIYGLKLFNPNLGWSSGPSALNLASSHGYDTIYILGFDYIGTGKKNEFVNNIYAGTHNYKRVEERATYYGNWSRQTSLCIKRHPRIKYIRVIEHEGSFVPDTLVGLPNLTHITVENFKKRFNIL